MRSGRKKIPKFRFCSGFIRLLNRSAVGREQEGRQRLRIDAAKKGIAKVRFIFRLYYERNGRLVARREADFSPLPVLYVPCEVAETTNRNWVICSRKALLLDPVF